MDTHVIVVGAGPVGLIVAGELRMGGVDVVVLERLAVPTAESRASTLHARTMELFDQRGLLRPLGTPPNEPMGHFGGVPLDLSRLPTRYPGQWKVLQARVEALLGNRAKRLGAKIRRRHELVGLTASRDRVHALVAGPTGRYSLTARYLVGCDGEESTVRRLAGIEMTGREATRELLRADVAGIDVPNRRFERLPHGLAIAARRPDGVTRVMVADFGRPVGRRGGPPSFDEVAKAWERITGEDITAGTPLWLNAFDNTSALAVRYRTGRVFLAGDAAHLQMPAGGQAINLGLQDGMNLGWKLAARASGRGSEQLLDTYHDERHAVGRRVLDNIEAQALLLLGDAEVDPIRVVLGALIEEPTVRDRLAATIAGLDVRYEPGWHPLVGDRLPHLDVRLEAAAGRRGRRANSVALLRSGRSLLLDLSAAASRRDWLRRALVGWDDVVDIVSATAQPGAPTDGLDTVLVRPDGYVAWASGDGADPRPALRRWCGRAQRR